MTRMLRTAVLALLAAGALPLQAQKGADQAAAMRTASATMYNRKLNPIETELRNDLVIMRDSLSVVSGFATRLERAVAQNMPSVSASALKELQPACAAASRTAVLLRPKIDAIDFRVEDQNQLARTQRVMRDFKQAFAAVGVAMAACEKDAGTLARSGAPAGPQLTALATRVGGSIGTYESKARGTMTFLDIPFRPKQAETPGSR